MDNECKGCEERYVGCHDNCEYYKAYKQWLKDKKEQEQKARMTQFYTPRYAKKTKKSKKKW